MSDSQSRDPFTLGHAVMVICLVALSGIVGWFLGMENGRKWGAEYMSEKYERQIQAEKDKAWSTMPRAEE